MDAMALTSLIKGSNYKIPKDIIPQDLSLQACLEIVKLQSDKGDGQVETDCKGNQAHSQVNNENQ